MRNSPLTAAYIHSTWVRIEFHDFVDHLVFGRGKNDPHNQDFRNEQRQILRPSYRFLSDTMINHHPSTIQILEALLLALQTMFKTAPSDFDLGSVKLSRPQ